MPEKLLNLAILPAGWACAWLAFVLGGRRAPRLAERPSYKIAHQYEKRPRPYAGGVFAPLYIGFMKSCVQ